MSSDDAFFVDCVACFCFGVSIPCNMGGIESRTVFYFCVMVPIEWNKILNIVLERVI